MTYSTSNPPVCLTSGLNQNVPNTWYYASTDAASTVDDDGYFSNGVALGMRVNDIVLVYDTDASPVIVTVHRVTSVNTTTGAVDLSDGDTLITGTDTN